MFVGHENVVRFRHGCVVDGLVSQFCHRVDHDFLAVVFDTDGGVGQGVEFDRLAVLRGEAVGFVGFRISHDRFLGFFPCQNASFKIHDLVAFCRQFVGCQSRSNSAAAIHGYRLFGRKCRFRFFDKVVLFDVDVECILDMSFIEFFFGSDIKQHHIVICDAFCEPVDIGVFEVVLAAGRGQA